MTGPGGGGRGAGERAPLLPDSHIQCKIRSPCVSPTPCAFSLEAHHTRTARAASFTQVSFRSFPTRRT